MSRCDRPEQSAPIEGLPEKSSYWLWLLNSYECYFVDREINPVQHYEEWQMITNEFRILLDAYTQASNDGDRGTAEALLRELDGLVVSSQYDRVRAEKTKGWTVG